MSNPALTEHVALNDTLAARSRREREGFDEGLQRARYDDALSHCQVYWRQETLDLFRRTLCDAGVKDALEIGSHGWDMVFTDGATPPGNLHCINISEAELDIGRRKAAARGFAMAFHRMDAHALEFADVSFDAVFGFGILHHLDYARALDEIRRVLRPGGKMIFIEPLGVNPIGELVRWATPAARTVDEAPLKPAHLDLFRRRFDVTFRPQQFVSVPAGLISRLTMKSPENRLMRAAYAADLALSRIHGLRLWFRKLVIVGVKPGE